MDNTINTNPTGAAPVTEPTTPTDGGEKTFTQAEVDALIAREKAKATAKATKGMPSEDEMKAFAAWKESQQSEKERWDNLVKDRDTAQSSLAAAMAKSTEQEHLLFVVGKGYGLEEADYIAYKAGKLVTDDVTFEQAVDQIIKSHTPQQGSQTTQTVKVNMGGTMAPSGGAPQTLNDYINRKLRGE